MRTQSLSQPASPAESKPGPSEAAPSESVLPALQRSQPNTDILLEIAGKGVPTLNALAQALPGHRALLLQAGTMRRALLEEGYPAQQLPNLSASRARLELYRLTQRHMAVGEYLPTPAILSPSTGEVNLQYGSLSVELPIPPESRSRFVVAGNTVVLSSAPDNIWDGPVVASTVFFSTPERPLWNPIGIAPGWLIPRLSPDGRWALTHDGLLNGPSFQLFDLATSAMSPCYTAFFAIDWPKFASDSRALLFVDTHTDRLRINRLRLEGAERSLHNETTNFSVEADNLLVEFSPQGNRVLISSAVTNASAVYRLDAVAPPVTIAAGDVDERYKRILWSADETRLVFFYADDKRAASFALDSSVAQIRPFTTDSGTTVNVEACQGDHLLTVRPEGDSDIWQLFTWLGKKASLPLSLPHGRRNSEDLSQLLGRRAVLAHDRFEHDPDGEQYFVDFSAPVLRPIPLSRGKNYELSPLKETAPNWLVGRLRGHPWPWPDGRQPTVDLVATDRADETSGDVLELPYEISDTVYLRPNGRSLLVARPNVGLLAFSLGGSDPFRQ